MKLLTETIRLATQESFELVDLTARVHEFCRKNRLDSGLLVISSRHTTAGIKINESCEDLKKDLKAFFEKIAPKTAAYFHDHSAIDGRANAPSHLLDYLLPTSEVVTLDKGRLMLGDWQTIFFVELDGPRKKREVNLTFMGTC